MLQCVSPQKHKYTKTQIRKNTNTQKHKYTKTQTNKYINTPTTIRRHTYISAPPRCASIGIWSDIALKYEPPCVPEFEFGANLLSAFLQHAYFCGKYMIYIFRKMRTEYQSIKHISGLLQTIHTCCCLMNDNGLSLQ